MTGPNPDAGRASPSARPAILIASTSWWAFPARLAIAFEAAGHRVEAICPAHHPLLKTRSVVRNHRYRALDPLTALADAMSQAEPALVVPCDDTVVAHLHELHRRDGASATACADAIERSMGSPDGYAKTGRRSEVIQLARDVGVRAPDMVPVATPEALRAGLARIGLPAVLKVDGTWGGFGVAVVYSLDQAERAFHRLSRPQGGIKAVKRLLVNGDPFPLRPWLRDDRRVVNLQRFVAGRPANSAVACWNGEILAHTEVEVVRSWTSLGASTVVRVIDNPEMSEAAVRLVRRLRLSGFCGLDFMIEDGTGAAHLVELNTRATPLSHLALGPGRDLTGALSARLRGAPAPRTASVTENDTIAYFPQAWHHDPESELLQNSYHDVPWDEPALIRELVKPPWPDRGLLPRFAAWLRSFAAGARRASAALRRSLRSRAGGRLAPAIDPRPRAIKRAIL